MTRRARPSRRERRATAPTPPLSITSLTDMATLLLVYLLATFATSPIAVPDGATALPISTARGGAAEATVVTITGPDARVVVDGAARSTPSTPRVLVDGRAVADVAAPIDDVAAAVRDALAQARARASITADVVSADGRVVVVADRRTPYAVVARVAGACAEAGFADVRLAVVEGAP